MSPYTVRTARNCRPILYVPLANVALYCTYRSQPSTYTVRTAGNCRPVLYVPLATVSLCCTYRSNCRPLLNVPLATVALYCTYRSQLSPYAERTARKCRPILYVPLATSSLSPAHFILYGSSDTHIWLKQYVIFTLFMSDFIHSTTFYASDLNLWNILPVI